MLATLSRAYQPPVPDPDWRALVKQLLREMDPNGVDQAVVVCACTAAAPAISAYALTDHRLKMPGPHP